MKNNNHLKILIMKQQKRQRMILLLALLYVYVLCHARSVIVSAFGVHQPILLCKSPARKNIIHRGSKSTTTATSSTMRMYIDAPGTEMSFQLLSSSVPSPPSSLSSSAPPAISSLSGLSDNEAEELLGDVSKTLAIDFSTTLVSPQQNTAVIRRLFPSLGRVLLLSSLLFGFSTLFSHPNAAVIKLFTFVGRVFLLSSVILGFSTLIKANTAVIKLLTLIGRILLLSSDYIQDKYLSPDEWVFQFFMLALSTRSFMRSAKPMISAAAAASSNSMLTVRDRKAYTLLFDIVGLSMLQFKTLLSSKTFEWVQLDSYEEIELNGKYMYWLYSGQTSSSIIRPGLDCNNSSSNNNNNCNYISNRVFGEVHFARKLQESLLHKAYKKNKLTKVGAIQRTAEASTPQIYACQDGAILLRISTCKLLELMKDDNDLSVSIQRLILLCMQEKLSGSFYEEKEGQDEFYERVQFCSSKNMTISV